MTAHIAEETFEIVTTTFEIERKEAIIFASEQEQYDALHKLLSERMLYFLDGQLEHLMNILYRIDLDENAVKKIFLETPPDRLPDELATLIIERQKQKVITRHEYRQTGSIPSDLLEG